MEGGAGQLYVDSCRSGWFQEKQSFTLAKGQIASTSRP